MIQRKCILMPALSLICCISQLGDYTLKACVSPFPEWGVWAPQGTQLVLTFSTDLLFTSQIHCPCSPRENTPSQPVMCCETWCSTIYCEAAWIPNGTFGTSSPSTIWGVIIIGLVGEVCFFPALRFSGQGESLLLLSLGYARSTSQNTGRDPFQGLALGRGEMASPDTTSVGYSSFIPQIYFEFLLWDPYCVPLFASPQSILHLVSLCLEVLFTHLPPACI